MADCNVCCEKFNKSTRKEIECVFCNYQLCRACFQKYTTDTLQDPHCMNCRKVFTRAFVSDACTNVFVTKTLKAHRENVLLDREKSLLPQTQPYVVLEKERRKIKVVIDGIEKEKQELLAQIHAKNIQITRLQEQMFRLSVVNVQDQGSSSEETTERRKFIRKCPMTDCRGFLSSQWKCGTCDTRICNKCNEEKGEDHQCHPDNVASMELLNKDSKPCPECATIIFKVSGCFAKDTPILLWNGTIKMSQEISIGDELVGDDGNLRTVLKTTTGIDRLFNVTQSDGVSYIVNSKHTLLLKPICNNAIHNAVTHYKVKWFDHDSLTFHTANFNYDETNKEKKYNEAVLFSKKLNFPEILEIKVDAYMNLPEKIKKVLLGFKGEGVNWEHRDIKIDPYILGLWLGDGNSNGAGFASNDNEIINYFMDWAKNNNLFIVHQDKYFFKINSYLNTRKPIGYEENCKACIKKECDLCSLKNENELIVPEDRPLNFFRKLLSEYNLINNKHIPDDFLMNSRENRLKLLAGIIDTDGCVRNEGKRIIISQVNVKFSEQIIILAKSLGYIVHHRIIEKKNIPFPNTDKLTDCKDQYQINISGNISEIPTILPRKKCVSSTPNKDYKKTSIKVTEIDRGEYFGFLIDGNHNFVLNDFTACQNCSQMFCTECHTPWDWNTGKKVTGVIHNPHYYEFMRAGGTALRNNGDIPCGGLPDIYVLRRSLERIPDNTIKAAFYSIHNVITHIQYYELRNDFVIVDPNANRDLRVKYLMNDISEDEFKVVLQQKEKQREKDHEFHEIHQMFVNVASDIYAQIHQYFLKNRSPVLANDPFLKEQLDILVNLTNYFNENSRKIGKMFKCVYPGIGGNYRYVSNLEKHLKNAAAN